MKRRNFIKLTSTASALSLLPTEVFALFNSVGMTTCPDSSSKKIVLIQLAGANDGLNTIVPINQYDTYATLRPNIKLNNIGMTNGIINLDSTLALTDQVGLHPSLSGFKSLYDKGFMRIIQGVGYPSQDKSHFKSTDLWLTGGDGTMANNNFDSGWTGRFLENYYTDYLNSNFPLGIQLGSSDNSLGFHGEVEHGMSLNISGQDLSGFYSVVNGLGGQPPANIPDSEYGGLIQYIINNDTSANSYAQTISNSFNNGSNSLTYPNTSLSNQLKTVARFISGGLQTKVYLVKVGGFDTHDMQVAANNTAHLGNHANLLTQISEAITTFITDLNNQNMANDVVAVTFSEFGRKAGENANLGTDHGEIAPMFVFGSAINPGISGTNINLSEAVLANNYQVRTVQHDNRRVFSTILQDWFGASNQTLDLTFYNRTTNTGFTNNKIADLIKTQNVVNSTCYTDKLLSVNEFKNSYEVIVYPNPTSELITINSPNNNDIYSISIYSIDGKFIGKYKNPLSTSQLSINVENLATGFYNLKIETANGNFSKKIIVRR
ncbi:DUF1501 domain-containing protein [Flavobacterium xinjiangense]|uniref:Por secretion system C-terminal sorting domain-containing protein n=1 Tax=Flavobacterium xinjiangense TaxID=178356 RepID=A0A1M7NSV7_9FLAO|nr:DUF1501 domain-containing protein [Flavobacterium xinjiangense]SHN07109.1 Por secretion system C-terminal sorting domain-containing protein [Flavobacterium xinjiangense]